MRLLKIGVVLKLPKSVVCLEVFALVGGLRVLWFSKDEATFLQLALRIRFLLQPSHVSGIVRNVEVDIHLAIAAMASS